MDGSESWLTSAEGAAGPHTTEAFDLLSDDTRLEILLALWEEYDPQTDNNAVPFSRLFERVRCDDPGNLRYHLERLRGQFVRQHAEREGYELRQTGMKIVRSVIAGAGVREVTLEPTEIDQACLLCGAPTIISYRDGLLYWACSRCGGIAPEKTETDGFMSAVPCDPAGLADRSPEGIRLASLAAERRVKQSMFDGFCPDCSGPVEGWLEYCTDHDSAAVCETCGRTFAVRACFQCQVCKKYGVSSPKTLALFHPAVTSFYDDYGVSIRIEADNFEDACEIFDRMHDHEMELVSTTPPMVEVTVSMNDNAIQLTFDETVSVVDVRR